MKTRSLALALACACIAPGLQAATSASAQLGAFQVLLFDLDKNDGIAPAITFAPRSFGSQVFGGALDELSPAQGESFGLYAPSIWGPVSSAVTIGTAQAAASVNASGQLAGASFAASGSSTRVPSSAFDDVGYFSLASIGDAVFEVTPKTLVLIRAPLDLQVSASGGVGQVASASVSLSVSSRVRESSDSREITIDTGRFPDAPSTPSPVHIEGELLSVSFWNLTAAQRQGQLDVDVSIYGGSFLPEPSSYLMFMVGGLGLLAYVRRMKRAA